MPQNPSSLRWRRVAHHALALLCFVPLVALAACRSTDPALLDAEKRPIATWERASYRLAVAPFAFEEKAARGAGPEQLGLRTDEAALTARLVFALRELNSASEVVEASSRNYREIPRDGADLLLIPTLRSASFEPRGATAGAGLGFVAWYATWIGGQFVEDYDYTARLRVTAELVRVEDGRILDRFEYSTADEGPMTLSFYERNEAFEGGFFTTLILPPFLTADDAEVLVDSLTERATLRVAARVKRALLEELPQIEYADIARVEWIEPRAETRITGSVIPVVFAVKAKQRINEILFFVDGAAEPSFAVPAEELNAAFRAGVFSLRWGTDLKVDGKRSRHRIRIDVVDEKGRTTRRTVICERSEGAGA